MTQGALAHSPVDGRPAAKACEGPARRRAIDPSPSPGLRQRDFRKIAPNGFGDAHNAYPHSMAWYKGTLYVGTTRSNFCMLRASQSVKTNLEQWPVECPKNLYDLDMRAQIWRKDPDRDAWTEVLRSPWIPGSDGTTVPREMGYRCMTVFQGESDPEPALYASTYASAKGQGTQILRSTDGFNFTLAKKPDDWDHFITSLRLLVPFKGRLFAAPTGRAYSNPNAANLTVVYESRDPVKGGWVKACIPSFGDRANIGIFELLPMGDYLYAGTGSLRGFQIWRTDGEGDPPYRWERVVTDGAYRGVTNQGVASMCVFKNALYVGSGIQNGGVDIANKVGPAGSELIRIHPDGSWDLIVGMPRDTPLGRKEPLSGYFPGFNNFFNGYFWRMGTHAGWIYLGTYEWSFMLQFSRQASWPPIFRGLVKRIGFESINQALSGAELYRSHDGENWLPVTTNGFDNPYNFGIRTLVSTPFGFAVGTCNPYGPRVAKRGARGWYYEDNPRSGLEIWMGHRDTSGI